LSDTRASACSHAYDEYGVWPSHRSPPDVARRLFMFYELNSSLTRQLPRNHT